MADSVNMSLDEIIKKNKEQNRTSRSRERGRGGGTVRGRGGGRGGTRGRGRGRGGRGQSQTRAATPGRQGRSRSRSRTRGPRGRSQSRGRAQSRGRTQSRGQSRTRQNLRSQSQNRSFSRSRSRSRIRGLTPKGRAGLEEQLEMPPLVRRNRFNRGGLRRSNSVQNLANSVHNRLGMITRRGAGNVRRPLVRRGVAKRGRGLGAGNIYSNVGLRSDEILHQQRQSLRLQNALVRSQTFTRSRIRNNSFSSPSQLLVKVPNDFAMRKRRNSFSNANYLNRQSLQQLTDQLGGYNGNSSPGSIYSVASSKSNRSMRSNTSNRSRGRGRGRGRGGRGVGRNFVAKQVLNPKLQQEIAAIQGKSLDSAPAVESPLGVNFAPTPAATGLTLHQRFGSTS